MKAFLMYKDRDFDPKQLLSRRDKYRRNASNSVDVRELLPWNERDLERDLGLDILCKAMGGEDEFLLDIAGVGLLSSVADVESIRYRHRVLADCLKNQTVIRELYAIAAEAVQKERSNSLWVFTRHPTSVLYRSVQVLEMFVLILKRLRSVAEEHAHEFDSDGFSRLFSMLKDELSDGYFAEIEAHLRRLKFKGGVSVSARLGKGNKGADYVLRAPPDARGWLDRLAAGTSNGHTWQVDPRDEVGAKTLSELNDTALNLVANAAGQSADHIVGFFQMLREELGFYIGCMNLHAALSALGEPVCTPVPAKAGTRTLSFAGLYDASLALSANDKIVGNDLNADGKNLLLVTGANTGGKSTFLRSVGLAQLMMQAGMFVAAESFSAEVCSGIFTHYKREEDRFMESGKWDEEMNRMSAVVDHLKPNALMLFNESFASTNEREGAEIAGQIVRALLEKRIKVFYVTHLYSLAHGIRRQNSADAMFLRAERKPDGTRPFKLVEAEPLETSYGEDLYERIFAPNKQAAPNRERPGT